MTTGQQLTATGQLVTAGERMTVRNAMIPVRDGTQLAVTLCFPPEAFTTAVPARERRHPRDGH
jgi:predicted acyl esterase